MEQSKAVLSWCISCGCWAFTFKPFQRFVVAPQLASCCASLPFCTNKLQRAFWCKCSRVCTSHRCFCSGLCVARIELLLFILAFNKWNLLRLQQQAPMLVSHLSCASPACARKPPRASVSNIVMLLGFFFPPFSFVDESIYCTNIGRVLKRLKQYRSGLITTVNVPQTWSTDRHVFICTINTNRRNPRTAVWRSAFLSRRRSLAAVGFLPTRSI